MEEEGEIEIDFRLDNNGRTALHSAEDDDNNETIGLQYATRVMPTGFDVKPESDLYDELLFDCEIADSGLMPRTFWVPADEKTEFVPRCTLEQMASDIFLQHTSSCRGIFDPATSGAEWWVQLRPSPDAGRYSMHASDDNSGVYFHWDKDEDLRILCGGGTYVHPHLSTVTYLTDFGAPTLVAGDFRVNNLTGDWIQPKSGSSTFLSWPSTGKHLCFDGRFLHSAPPDIMERGIFQKQTSFKETNNEKRNAILRRRHRRCTFLVNIWLNHKPLNVHPFPESMIDKLSGCVSNSNSKVQSSRIRLSFMAPENESTCVTDVVVIEKKLNKDKVEIFSWPLGESDSKERVQATIPLSLVRSKASFGGNVNLMYSAPDDFTLLRDDVQPIKKRSRLG